MRGHAEQTTHMFSYLSPEQRVPADHPLRAVRALTDEALQTMSRRFASLYATTGRPSIPPEQLLRALLLQVLYTVRSERLLMEELTDNLLFRWFVGLNMDDPVWHPTTLTKNRDRLLSGDVAAAFFDAVQAHARAAGLLSDEHFTVDGTQLEAWASLKSFRCVDAAESDPPEDPGNPTVNFHGERRRNDTHQSTTDPEAMLHRKGKGKEATLAYLGHVLLDNRQGLVAKVLVPVAVDSPRRYTGAMNAIDERACGKPGCDNFGKPGLNIVGHGWFVTKSGRRRRYRCTVCGGTLRTNTGTAYRGLRCSRREFDQVASLRVEGVSISATARVTGGPRALTRCRVARGGGGRWD